MSREGIATGRYFPPIHLQPAWQAWFEGGARASHLQVTESMGRRTLALPFFNRITSEQQEQVARALTAAIALA
jgi:dTDP-4-amino-4,6-dideoxygalactose transaminase